MTTVVLAAGQGTRLRPLTDDRPKCLVDLAGRPLLARLLDSLSACGLGRPVIVGGYRAALLDGFGTVVLNPAFETTNMVSSLMCARPHMTGGEDLVVCYGDIVIEPRVLAALLASDAPAAVAVNTDWLSVWQARMADPLADAETLRIAPDGRLLELGKKPERYDQIEAQYMGLFKIRADHVGPMLAAYDALPPDGVFDGKPLSGMYMTSFLQHLIDSGWAVQAVPVHGGWLEVDTVDDLETYERLHAEGRLATLCDLGGA